MKPIFGSSQINFNLMVCVTSRYLFHNRDPLQPLELNSTLACFPIHVGFGQCQLHRNVPKRSHLLLENTFFHKFQTLPNPELF